VAFLAAARPITTPLDGFLAQVGLCLACSYAILLTGFRVRRRIGLPGRCDPAEAFALDLGLGCLLVMLAMFALGVLGLFAPWAAWTLLGVLLLGPHRAFALSVTERIRILGEDKGSWTWACLLAAAAGMTLLVGLAPVTSQDALVYHLAVPAKHIEAGRLVWIDGNFFSAFPQNVEMLFTWGLLLRDDSLAQWFHWLLGAGAGLAVSGLARRIRSGAPRLLAAALFGTIPTVMLIAGWAYVDLGVVLFATLSTSLFLCWLEEPAMRWATVSAAFAGAAAGCKYTGGFQGILVAAGVLLVLLLRREPLRRALLQSALAAGVVGLVACPWWIRNSIEAGNPLYPFAFGIFGGRSWDAERAQVLSQFLAQWGGQGGLWEALSLPWRLTFSARFFSEDSFDGMVGAAFFMGAPLVVLTFLRGSMALRAGCAFALAHALFWVQTTQQVRFLLPALATGAALISASLPPPERQGTGVRVLRAGMLLACTANVVLASLHFAHHNPLPVVLGLEPRGSYLRREIPCGDYPVFEAIERTLPPDSYILLGSTGNPGFLVKRRYYADALFENRTLGAILAEAADGAAAHAALRERGFTHLLFRLENVLDGDGNRSDIPLDDQRKLMDLLNAHARLVSAAGGTYLYELLR